MQTGIKHIDSNIVRLFILGKQKLVLSFFSCVHYKFSGSVHLPWVVSPSWPSKTLDLVNKSELKWSSMLMDRVRKVLDQPHFNKIFYFNPKHFNWTNNEQIIITGFNSLIKLVKPLNFVLNASAACRLFFQCVFVLRVCSRHPRTCSKLHQDATTAHYRVVLNQTLLLSLLL